MVCIPTTVTIKPSSVIRANGKKATRPRACGYLGHYTGRCHCTADVTALPTRRNAMGEEFPGRCWIGSIFKLKCRRCLRKTCRARARATRRSRCVSKVDQARIKMRTREGKENARVGAPEIERHCAPGCDGCVGFVKTIDQSIGAFGPSLSRILKVARSIAHLADRGAFPTLT